MSFKHFIFGVNKGDLLLKFKYERNSVIYFFKNKDLLIFSTVVIRGDTREYRDILFGDYYQYSNLKGIISVSLKKLVHKRAHRAKYYRTNARFFKAIKITRLCLEKVHCF